MSEWAQLILFTPQNRNKKFTLRARRPSSEGRSDQRPTCLKLAPGRKKQTDDEG